MISTDLAFSLPSVFLEKQAVVYNIFFLGKNNLSGSSSSWVSLTGGAVIKRYREEDSFQKSPIVILTSPPEVGHMGDKILEPRLAKLGLYNSMATSFIKKHGDEKFKT